MFGAKRKNTADISESGNPRHPEATARAGIPATRKLGVKGFATFLGFSEGSHSVSLPSMLSEMVFREVENRLAPNPISQFLPYPRFTVR